MGLAERLAKLERMNSSNVGRIVIYDVHSTLQEYHLSRCLDALLKAVPTAPELDGLWQRIVKDITTDADSAALDAIPRDSLHRLDPALFPHDAAKLIARICELWCSIQEH